MSIANQDTLPSPQVNLTQPELAELESAQLELAQLELAQSEVPLFPPSDLYSDEPPLETYLHLRQLLLLLACLEWHWRDRTDFFAAGNLTVYYSPKQLKSEDFRGPDFFVVLDTERRPRKSWVVWEEEGKYPNVIVELLSESTAKTDRGLKKQIYQDIFRTPEYFWYDPNGTEFAGFALMQGRHQPMQPDERGWLWSEQLQLFLGVAEGKLRFFTPEGQLVLLPEEAAQQEQEQRLAAEQQAAEAQQQVVEAQQQVTEAQQQATQAEQRAAEAEALLAQYRARFGEID